MENQYQDYGYKTLAPGNGESGRKLAERIVSIVNRIPGIRTICDLGCGNGYVASRLALEGYGVTGVDASESGISLAQQNYGSENTRFLCAAIDSSLVEKLSGGHFDLVFSSDVIEHLYRPALLIETALNLLRPGGHLLIGTPYHGYIKNLALSFLNKWDAHHTVDWDGGHIKFFSVKTLRALLLRHGFTDLRFCYYGRGPFIWKNMICHARKPA